MQYISNTEFITCYRKFIKFYTERIRFYPGFRRFCRELIRFYTEFISEIHEVL